MLVSVSGIFPILSNSTFIQFTHRCQLIPNAYRTGDTLTMFRSLIPLGTLVLGCPGRALKTSCSSPAVLERATCQRCSPVKRNDLVIYKSSVAAWLKTKKLRTTFLFYVRIATNMFFVWDFMPGKSTHIYIYTLNYIIMFYFYIYQFSIFPCCIWFCRLCGSSNDNSILLQTSFFCWLSVALDSRCLGQSHQGIRIQQCKWPIPSRCALVRKWNLRSWDLAWNIPKTSRFAGIFFDWISKRYSWRHGDFFLSKMDVMRTQLL